ncbi:MAG: hypothetical protein M3Q03_07485 [Chloroflexota bacterium]|nr:hypothetical protein [Chloroflexota bacterium]
MRGCVLGLLVVLLILCVGGAALGYFVGIPWARTAISKGRMSVSNTMADAVTASVSRRIEERALRKGELVIRAADIDVNNTELPGEAGIETGTDGTWIYGLETEISPTGIALVVPGEPDATNAGHRMALAVPVVEDRRVELTEVEVAFGVMRFFLSEDAFEQGMEAGINRALQAHGLTPTSITLRNGQMTIQTELESEPSTEVGAVPVLRQGLLTMRPLASS